MKKIYLVLISLLLAASATWAAVQNNYGNFAYGTLTNPVTSAATTLDVTFPSNALSFPTGTSTAVIYLESCSNPSTCSQREIVQIALASGATYSILSRAQEGTTTPARWEDGANISGYITAGLLTELKTNITAGAGDLVSTNNLSDVANAATARTNLGLAIGTNVQAYDADLTTYAGITPSANIQTLLGSADFSAARTNLGLAIGTNVQAYDADLTTYAGITPSANIQTLLGSADFSAARTNLGLAIGTNVQAYDADLTTYAGITPSANAQTLLGHTFAEMLSDIGAAASGHNHSGVYQPVDTDLTTIAGLSPLEGRLMVGSASPAWSVMGYTVPLTICDNGYVWKSNGTNMTCQADSTGGSPTFDTVGSGINTSATMTVGTGASLVAAGSGSIVATSTTGNAATATALAANGTNASAGYAILGVDASGNAEGAWQVTPAAIGASATGHDHSGVYQAADADLTTYAGITPSANIQTLLGSADFSAARTNLGLAIGTNVQAYDADLATLAGSTAWRLFYSNGTSVITELALGADGTYLRSNGAAAAPTFDTPAASGDVTDVFGCTSGNCNALTAASGDSLNMSSGDSSIPWKVGTTAALPATCSVGQSYWANDSGKGLYLCTSTNTWSTVYEVGADGSYRIVLLNNTAISPTAATNEQYFEANIYKVNQNGTESSVAIGPTAGQVSFTGPTAARAFALPDAAATILTTNAAVTPAQGGTGVANGANNTITFTGNYTLGVTLSNNTAVTLPTSGTLLASGGALGTPSGGTLTNCTGLPVAGITASTSTALGVGSVELGHASDTTLARSAAGKITVESNPVAYDATQTSTHASPSTTNPLSPTWTGVMHTVWYGATGTINLPAASGYAGRGILIYNTGAYTITIDSNGSEVIVRDGTAQTGGVSMTLSSGAGNYVALICDGARWVTLGYKGTLAEGS